VGAAAGPAADVEDRPDRLGSLLHVQQAEVAATLGDRAGVGLDAWSGVVDRQRRAGLRRAVADDDRRLAVLHGVRKRLLGDPEERQLDVGRRPGPVSPLEADLAAGKPLDPKHEPVERRADAEIVEDRQPKVAADRPQPLGDRPAQLRAFLVAGRLEAADEQRQLLERVVVDVGRESGSFRFRGGDDEVALELGAASHPGGRTVKRAAAATKSSQAKSVM
jgi:hypothetical protein